MALELLIFFPGMRFLRISLFLWFLCGQTWACSKVLSLIGSHIPHNLTRFDDAAYQKQLDFFISRRGKYFLEREKTNTVEQKLALLDSLRPEELRSDVKSLSRWQKFWLGYYLKGVDLKKGTPLSRLTRWYQKTYQYTQPTSDSVFRKWRIGHEALLKEQLKLRWIEAFADAELEQAAKRFKITKPDPMWRQAYLYLVSYFVEATSLPKPLLKKSLKKGFEMTFPEIEKELERSETKRLFWKHLRQRAFWGTLSLFSLQELRSYLSDDDSDEKQGEPNTIPSLSDDTDAIVEELVKDLPEDAIDKEVLRAWVREYVKKHGIAPKELPSTP